jgi:membrane protein DedA with SNARE-associated domain
VLFAFVLAEQVGLPIPAVPVLLGVGALAGAGRMSLVPALVPGGPGSLAWASTPAVRTMSLTAVDIVER